MAAMVVAMARTITIKQTGIKAKVAGVPTITRAMETVTVVARLEAETTTAIEVVDHMAVCNFGNFQLTWIIPLVSGQVVTEAITVVVVATMVAVHAAKTIDILPKKNQRVSFVCFLFETILFI